MAWNHPARPRLSPPLAAKLVMNLLQTVVRATGLSQANPQISTERVTNTELKCRADGSEELEGDA